MITLVALLFAVATLAGEAQAIGSGSKTPEEKAAEAVKKATGKYNNGVKHMEKARAIAERGDSAFAYNYRATADAKTRKEYEKAVKDFKEALRHKANMADAFNNLGYCYRKLGKLKLSLESYQSALAIRPKFLQAREYLGETYLAMDMLDSALAQHRLLIEAKSLYADTLAASIELYKLQQFEKTMRDAGGK
jgi:tetratricopeptide (TPR) repeat protein